MKKNESCALTEREWKYLCGVFDEYLYNSDTPEKTYKKLQNIHMKIFFIDALIKQKEEK